MSPLSSFFTFVIARRRPADEATSATHLSVLPGLGLAHYGPVKDGLKLLLTLQHLPEIASAVASQ